VGRRGVWEGERRRQACVFEYRLYIVRAIGAMSIKVTFLFATVRGKWHKISCNVL